MDAGREWILRHIEFSEDEKVLYSYFFRTLILAELYYSEFLFHVNDLRRFEFNT
jgi:hypothetical protein